MKDRINPVRRGRRIGLVLSGGGGKGAYAVGVWKAMEERGLANDVTVFSGASVGALNAVLFALHDSRFAENIWEGISPGDILRMDPFQTAAALIQGVQIPEKGLSQLGKIAVRGVFSRSGMNRILDTCFDIDRLSKSEASVYAACSRLLPPGSVYFRLNGMPEEKARRVLMASSAIPLVFGREEIDGAAYYDGGLFDNVPVRPAVDAGCDLIVAVLLNRSDRIRYEVFPGTEFISISPRRDLGGLMDGTLNFKKISKKIQEGYADGLAAFEAYKNRVTAGM